MPKQLSPPRLPKATAELLSRRLRIRRSGRQPQAEAENQKVEAEEKEQASACDAAAEVESGAEVKKRQAEAETNSEVVGMDKSFLES